MKKTVLLYLCLMLTSVLFAQTMQVSGVVSAAEDGLPLPGVNITVKDVDGSGTITDIDGKFSIKVPKGKSLSFSYIGYKEELRVINSNIVLKIFLDADTKLLDEVVAIGYGTMKKSDLTGAVGSITGKDLKMAPVARVDQALQGRMAGVTVNSNSGQPGADAIIRIRGVGTVGNSSPIYVVDGIVTDNINFLSTGDVASLEVLKDASTAAIYGSRGANGVILITTKKGDSTGKTNITVESYAGTQNRWKNVDVMGRDEFSKMRALLGNTKNELESVGLNEWIRSNYTPNNNTSYPRVIEYNTDGTLKTPGIDYTLYDTDWQNEVFVKDAMIQNYYLSFDGGTDKANYLVSVNSFDQKGTLIGSYYNRLTLRLNTSFLVKKWLRIGENLSFTNSHSYNVQGNGNTALISSALSMAPWDPVMYPEGSLSGYPRTRPQDQRDLSGRYSTPSLFRNVMHPYNQVFNSKPNNNNDDLVGNLYLEITPIKGLVVRGDVSMKLWNGMNRTYTPVLDVIYNAITKNSVSASMSRTQQLTYETTATYKTTINERHELTAMAGASIEEINYYSVSASGDYLLNDDPKNWYVGKTLNTVIFDAGSSSYIPTRSGGDGVGKGRMASYFGRLHYSLDNKYLLTANFRYDGSSKLSGGLLWRAFPSLAGAWKVSEEEFFEPIRETVDFLKIRAGWGLMGNDRSLSENAAFPEAWNSGTWMVGYPFGTPSSLENGTGLSVGSFPQLIEWERTNQSNVGIDFGILGKLSGSLDLFSRYTEGMHMAVKAPAHVGFRYDVTANAATVRNQGVELSLEYRDKIGSFNYSVGGNISLIENKLTAVNGGQTIWNGFIMSDEGYALNTIYVLKYDGVFQTKEEIDAYTWTNPETNTQQLVQPNAKPGDARYADLNNDGQITDLDRFDAGNSFPPVTYGFNATAGYKGFDFQVFFQGVAGNEVYNGLRQNKLEYDGSESVLSTDMRNVFYPVRQDPSDPTSPWINGMPGSNGSIPNPTATGSTDNKLASNRFVEDASYLRLKNLQLGYTVPSDITNKLGINRVRFYIGGSNLLTITKYKGFDPEVGNLGRDYGNFPQARTMIVGLNMNF
jgi:TonB-linked SusC/RagA family outer membrane protein